MNVSDFNSTKLIDLATEECFGNYLSIALGVALLISEVLPFIQRTSKKSDPVAIVDYEQEGKVIEGKKRPTLLQDANGVFHTLYSLYKRK